METKNILSISEFLNEIISGSNFFLKLVKKIIKIKHKMLIIFYFHQSKLNFDWW